MSQWRWQVNISALVNFMSKDKNGLAHIMAQKTIHEKSKNKA